MTLPPQVLAATEACLEEWGSRPMRVRSASPVGGGCINPSARVQTVDGESFFLKWNDSAPEGMFDAEADGLRALAAPGTLRVPEIMGWGGSCTGSDPGWLLMEFIPSGAPTPGYGDRLGEGLARLHGSTESAPTFGWSRSNFIGSLPQENHSTEDWASFWRDRRILPQYLSARNKGYFSGRESAPLEILLERMEEILPPDGPHGPALLHGDLWSGNYFPDGQGTPVLIDPAVYRGDGEVDLAMMELFGSLPGGFEEAYEEERGISPEYSAYRKDLYQLYYLLVHVNLFGGGYAGGSLAAVRRILSEV